MIFFWSAVIVFICVGAWYFCKTVKTYDNNGKY